MEVEPLVGDAPAPAVGAAAAESEGPHCVAPSEEEQDAPPADGIVLSDRVLGHYGNATRAGTRGPPSQDPPFGTWDSSGGSTTSVPDDLLDQLRDDDDDGSVGSDEDVEMEEAERGRGGGRLRGCHGDQCLGMKMVDEETVIDDETTGASSPNSIVRSNRKGGRKGDVPVTAAGAAPSLDRLPETGRLADYESDTCSEYQSESDEDNSDSDEEDAMFIG